MMRFQRLFYGMAALLAVAITVSITGYGTPNQMDDSVRSGKDAPAERESLVMTYPVGNTISVKFVGTDRLPRAIGEAKVARKKDATEIEIGLDEMKPAKWFGGDYNTYVLWAVSLEGQATNLGEFILNRSRSKLRVKTPLTAMGLFVTAEPHFMVSKPSTFVVLENARPAEDPADGTIPVQRVRYRGFEGTYFAGRESLANVSESTAETSPELQEAETAIELAMRAGADRHAIAELEKARDSLKQARTIAAQIEKERRDMVSMGREAVRLALEAQRLAEERSTPAALDTDRK